MADRMEEKFENLNELVELFERNKKQYHTKIYDEANTRTDFIDKFFELLDWDVRNEQGYSETYREVVREDKVSIEGKQKAPDYSFRIGGMRKFFVEAKKPSVNIKDDPNPAFQVRRYGYTAKLPLSILTDFEEFAVYDTRIKPSKNDKASTARIFYCSFDEYKKNFDFIFNTFSKEAILKGSFDLFVQENKNKKGTSEVDKELLKLIENWRESLAKNIALRNGDLKLREVNTAVQKIIDRIIFLRIAEDKEIEPYEQLLNISKKENVYKELVLLFEKANDKYNSGLFLNQTWLNEIKIDDKTCIDIIKALYYPECPYEFSILPVEILGNIYEKFLGKTIEFRNVGRRCFDDSQNSQVSSERTSTRHTIRIHEKPEVKKAGGVYYTPQYIVKHIVENTIGVKIKGKKPEDIKALKVLDPACGSGSFLVEAYQFLMNFHLDYYGNSKNKNKALKNGKIYQVSDNSYKLTIEEKQNILLNNIYGVDIDEQAVEVTKLSLYLKLLENEGKEAQGQLFKFSDMKLLPSLSDNIKCGNSLVGSDYYLEKDLSLFDDEAMRKINVFDWEKEFKEIFAQGGFDCVIGNPPYVFARESKDKGMMSEDKDYYYNHYQVAKYQINLYHLFIEKACSLLSDNGLFSYIIPNNWLTINSNKDLRYFVLNKSNINILNFKYKVFDGADIDTCILSFTKSDSNKKIVLAEAESKDDFKIIKETNIKHFLDENDYIINIEVYKNEAFTTIVKKIENNSETLSTYAEIKAGLQAYEVGKGIPKQTKETKLNRIYHSKEKNDDSYFQYIDGIDVKRYSRTWEKKEYLKYGKNLAAPRKNWDLFSTPRILVRQIPSKPPYCINACYTEKVFLNDRNSMNIIYINPNPLFILAVLNSRAVSFWFEHKFGKLSRGIFPQFKVNELANFPIPNTTLENQEPLAKLAEQMIKLQKELQEAKMESDKKLLQQHIDILDSQIDRAVYKLYGLTEEEIEIVEDK